MCMPRHVHRLMALTGQARGLLSSKKAMYDSPVMYWSGSTAAYSALRCVYWRVLSVRAHDCPVFKGCNSILEVQVNSVLTMLLI